MQYHAEVCNFVYYKNIYSLTWNINEVGRTNQKFCKFFPDLSLLRENQH